MIKSPDEIKKGLECCKDTNCKVCPYFNIHRCAEENGIDALALIQQLEAQNAELLEKVEQLQAERDAAVSDLEHVKDCDSCKYDNACFTGKKDCFGCHEKRCPCLTCQYEWRGVQKEE